MHNIEPYYLWRDIYISENDPNALNYKHQYSEFHYTNQVYNYLLHPQWDNFGSETLLYKLLFVDYDEQFCIIELIGEWNDAIHNDIMLLKTELIESLMGNGIQNYILITENVLNFHAISDDYYQEWKDEIDGDIFLINALPHVLDELSRYHLDCQLSFGGILNDLPWRNLKPDQIMDLIQKNYLND